MCIQMPFTIKSLSITICTVFSLILDRGSLLIESTQNVLTNAEIIQLGRRNIVRTSNLCKTSSFSFKELFTVGQHLFHDLGIVSTITCADFLCGFNGFSMNLFTFTSILDETNSKLIQFTDTTSNSF